MGFVVEMGKERGMRAVGPDAAGLTVGFMGGIPL
jgi:hypothetical protein